MDALKYKRTFFLLFRLFSCPELQNGVTIDYSPVGLLEQLGRLGKQQD